ncbi:MAG TPA: PIN domain-containing protein [Prolixibacteraceae bacterium]|mgnify:CR=1 FL=1|nr:PIN domain-containing protein [Prolixibacteraceae bacterium]
MKNILIDTDVILDFFFDRKPFSDQAAVILSLCETNRINGFITPVICSNVYYLLRKTATHGKVVEKLRLLLNFINVLTIDKEIIIEALSSGFSDFEDALQNFSATTAGSIDAIVTRNVKDFSKSQLGVFTPEDFLRTLINKE